ncbi:MAG: hypothetical protein HY720_03670 [Planctomycetes bacterium]|nr:hypothetical protein [Planctomycetota bacterium]
MRTRTGSSRSARAIAVAAILLAGVAVVPSVARGQTRSCTTVMGNDNVGSVTEDTASTYQDLAYAEVTQKRGIRARLLGRQYQIYSQRTRARHNKLGRQLRPGERLSASIDVEIDLAGRRVAITANGTWTFPVLGISKTFLVGMVPVTVGFDVGVRVQTYSGYQYLPSSVVASQGVRAGLGLTAYAGVGVSFRGFRLIAGIRGTASPLAGSVDLSATFRMVGKNLVVSSALTGRAGGYASIELFAQAGPFGAALPLAKWSFWERELFRWSL